MGTSRQVPVMVDFDGEVSADGMSYKGGKRIGFMGDMDIVFDEFIEVLHSHTGAARSSWDLELLVVSLVGQQDGVMPYDVVDKSGVDIIFHLFEKDDRKALRFWVTKRQKEGENNNVSHWVDEVSVHPSVEPVDASGEVMANGIADGLDDLVVSPASMGGTQFQEKGGADDAVTHVRLGLNKDLEFENEHVYEHGNEAAGAIQPTWMVDPSSSRVDPDMRMEDDDEVWTDTCGIVAKGTELMMTTVARGRKQKL